MRPLPFERIRLLLQIGIPQAHPVIMGDGEAITLRREGEAPGGGGGREALFLPLAITRRHFAPSAPGDTAFVMQGERVDPCAPAIGEITGRAVGAGDRDAPVIAACDEALAVARRTQDAAVRMYLYTMIGAITHQQHAAIAETEGGGGLQEADHADMRAGIDALNGLGEIGNRIVRVRVHAVVLEETSAFVQARCGPCHTGQSSQGRKITDSPLSRQTDAPNPSEKYVSRWFPRGFVR